jgi:hypothetical protein
MSLANHFIYPDDFYGCYIDLRFITVNVCLYKLMDGQF